MTILPYFFGYLPSLPLASGPTLPVSPSSLNTPKAQAKAPTPTSASASSSDHEGGDDLSSSIHTGTSASSKAGGYESSASGTGLDGSWVGLDEHGRE